MKVVSLPTTPAQLLTVEEAGMLLKVSRGRAYELLATGALPSLRIGRRRRIRLRDVEAFVDAAEAPGPRRA